MALILALILVTAASTVSATVTGNYSCNFDGVLCGWSHDVSLPIKWTMQKGRTLSRATGPHTDASGSGQYLYVEASRRPAGTKAGLISPIIQGPHCMTFMYHMYGGTMGSVIVYTNTTTSQRLVWIKSRSQTNQWLKAIVQLNETQEYQVLFHGIVGSSWSSDCAIDDVKFFKGVCIESPSTWLHVYFRDDEDKFKIAPYGGIAMGLWDYQFSFLAFQVKRHETDKMYFAYPSECSFNSLSTELPAILSQCYPFEFFYASSLIRGANESKVLLLNRKNGTVSRGFGLEKRNDLCCGDIVEGFFYARVSIIATSLCSPGWTAVGETCVYIPERTRMGLWSINHCAKVGGTAIRMQTVTKFQAVTKYIDKLRYQYQYSEYYIGASPAEHTYKWLWVNQLKVPDDITSSITDVHTTRNCGVLKRTSGSWGLAAATCDSVLQYACSRKENSLGDCTKGWIHVNSYCYHISTKTSWTYANQDCKKKASTLAIIDHKSTIKLLGQELNTLLPSGSVQLFIGLQYLPEFRWTDGNPIDKGLWLKDYPKVNEALSLQCVVLYLTSFGWRLMQLNCKTTTRKVMCETDRQNQAYKSTTFSESDAEFGHHSYAVDGNYASCFQTKQTQNPWLKIKLVKKMFIARLDIAYRMSCCLKADASFRVLIGGSSLSECTKYYSVYIRRVTVVLCSQSVKTTDVTIQIDGPDKTLTLCEVTMTAFDNQDGLRGVLQKLWHGLTYGSLAKLREDVRFPLKPSSVSMFKDFDAPYFLTGHYGKQLETYLQVPEGGNYSFVIACGGECELWIDNGGVLENKQRLIANLKQKDHVGHTEFDKYPSKQTSKPILLSHCFLYKMKMLVTTTNGYELRGFASVAMKFPNGSFEGPISHARLYWVYPGYKDIEFGLHDNKTTITTETSETPFNIRVKYKYCCRGAYCPACPARLVLDVGYTSVVVHEALAMDCIQHTSNLRLGVMVQPGTYPIKITHTYNGDMYGAVHGGVFGRLILQPKSIFKCDFTRDTCGFRNGNSTAGNYWNFTKSKEGEYLTLANDQQTAWLESTWMQSDSLMYTVGVCVTFDFYLSSESSLKVFLQTPGSDQDQLMWNLTGYQGDKWVKGQVAWKHIKKFKIVVIGSGTSKKAVSLNSMSLVAAECPFLPLHSKPGHSCDALTQFSCTNGQCIDKGLVCDGDALCTDGSDEKDCQCSSNVFSCPNGECLKPSQLCNGKRDCESDGSDEQNCARKCSKDDFQCVSGDCIPMYLTCDGQRQCIDGSDEPDMCGFSKCPLNNITCASQSKTSFDQHCAYWNVHCDFDEGSLCGLTKEINASFDWLPRSGTTPTRNTGPDYDHTTLGNKGIFLYLEASDRNPGEKAILSTDFLFGGRPVCVRFWYHMNGYDIGSLNVYYKTNQSQVLLWQRSGHVGNQWLFGQTTYNTTETFKIVIEGVVGSGALGDIAIDDLTISYGRCQKISHQENPSCYFEQDFCQWKVSQGWRLSRPGARPLPYDWNGTLGNYISISKATPSIELLVSPIVPSTLRCIRFWYYLSFSKTYGSEISVHVIRYRAKRVTIWRNAAEINKWQYVQLPLTHDTDVRIIIEGKRTSITANLLLDDITFDSGLCSQIPPTEKETQSFGATRHWKLDGTDSDLRTFGVISYHEDNGHRVAYFNGISGYFDSPALDLHSRNFSVVGWFNVRDRKRMNHIYSDWSYPHQFRFYVHSDRFVAELRGETKTIVVVSNTIFAKEWTMFGFTWSPITKVAKLYLNGKMVRKYTSKLAVDQLKLRSTNDAFYEIGNKLDSDVKYHGCMRDLMVFYRQLTAYDIMSIYSPSRLSCQYRQTTDGNCCVFPFIYKKIPRYTCLAKSTGSLFWCSTTANFDKDGKQSTCKVDVECNSVQNGWCGWKNVSGNSWMRGMRKEMCALEKQIDDVINNTQGKSKLVLKQNEYQVSFHEGHSEYINYTGIPDMFSYTVCMWVKTADTTNAGTAFVYQTKYQDTNTTKVAIAMMDYRKLSFMVNTRKVTSSIRYNDGSWHYICLRWDHARKHFSLNIDDRKYSKTFSTFPNTVIPGGGELIIGLTAQQKQSIGKDYGQFVGNITYFVLWNHHLSDSDIKRMSYDYRGTFGSPVASWEVLLSSLVGNSYIIQSSTCRKDFEGPRIMLNLMTGHQGVSSVYESILFDRSSRHHTMCLQFSYKIYSPASHALPTLRVYQLLKSDNYLPILVWELSNETTAQGMWTESEVLITGLSDFKLRFEGLAGRDPGYITVRDIRSVDGYCRFTKPTVCNETRTSSSGYLFSPQYPNTYSPNVSCTWRIHVNPNSIIRLHFLFFDLQDHPKCTKDYVTVSDNSKRLGKFCGSRYPEFVESTGNVMIVTFKSDGFIGRVGFKARYESRQVKRTEDQCMSYKGCPIGCQCAHLWTRQHGAVVVRSGHDVKMTAIPPKLPSETQTLLLGRNRVSNLHKFDLSGDFSLNLEYLDMSNNILIDIQKQVFSSLKNVKVLRLNSNFLRILHHQVFSETTALTTLDLSDNLISRIDSTLFTPLRLLQILSLRSNKISFLDGRTFSSNGNLTALCLDFNLIEVIPDDLLINQRNLKILYLNDNKIKKITLNTFKGLDSIEILFLQNNDALEFPPEALTGLKTLKRLKVDDFFLCCHADKAIPGVQCESPKDYFSSCSDLMKNRTLQVFIWILGLSALLGNVFVIFLRVKAKDDNKVHSFLLTNLAFADLLMGVYMMFIAVKDVQFQGEYFKHDHSWRNGSVCRIAGALSLLSSEASVILLTVITADRLKNIVFPFRGRKLSYNGARNITIVSWFACIIMSILPMVELPYFYDKTRRVGYYGRSALCLPLQLTKDKLAGWEYSVSIFIVLNLVSFVFILFAYVLMFITVSRSSRTVRSSSVKKESQLAKRMAFIIATDFCCWVPVIVIGILSLLGLFHDPEQTAYAWLAVFVIPVNSSINPFLYTLSTSLYIKKIMNNKVATSLALRQISIFTNNNSIMPSEGNIVSTLKNQREIKENKLSTKQLRVDNQEAWRSNDTDTTDMKENKTKE